MSKKVKSSELELERLRKFELVMEGSVKILLDMEIEKGPDHNLCQRRRIVCEDRLKSARERASELELIMATNGQPRRKTAHSVFKWSHTFFTSRESRIVKPPGTLLLRITELVVSKKRYEKECVTTVADWHEEYFEALDQKRAWPKFLFIRIRYTWAFAKSLLLLGAFAAMGKLLKSMFAGR